MSDDQRNPHVVWRGSRVSTQLPELPHAPETRSAFYFVLVLQVIQSVLHGTILKRRLKLSSKRLLSNSWSSQANPTCCHASAGQHVHILAETAASQKHQLLSLVSLASLILLNLETLIIMLFLQTAKKKKLNGVWSHGLTNLPTPWWDHSTKKNPKRFITWKSLLW